MDTKITRAGIYSAVILLLVGLVFNTFGGWTPIYQLPGNIFGASVLALVFCVLLAYVYFFWFDNFLPGTPVIRGALFGCLVWIFFLVLGGVSGFFKDSVYPQTNSAPIFLSLILNVIWGSFLATFLESKS